MNQFTIVENKQERRLDVVLFVNGLPLSVIELKNPTDEDATIRTAWRQLQTYKAELPSLFAFNVALFASDGTEARVGTLTTGREWFEPWRTVTGEELADPHMPQLQTMLAERSAAASTKCLPQVNLGRASTGWRCSAGRCNAGALHRPSGAGCRLRQFSCMRVVAPDPERTVAVSVSGTSVSGGGWRRHAAIRCFRIRR